MRTAAVILGVTLFLFPHSPIIAAENNRPNIILILADDLGYGDPGCYNRESKAATPNIDQLATQGIRFTDAYAPAAWCTPTRYGLLTGRYPFRTDLSWAKQSVIEENRTTLATLLSQHGYATACVGKWHLGFDAGLQFKNRHRLSGGPIDHGFQSYFGLHASLDLPPYLYIRNDRCDVEPTETTNDHLGTGHTLKYQGRFWRAGKIAPGFAFEQVLDRLTDEAIAVLRHHRQQDADRPLFLYYPMTAPHGPWLPGKSFQGRSQCGPYGDFVMHTDHAVGRVLQALDDLGFPEENTLVLFTSDNGPLWFEPDARRYSHRASYIFRGQKGDIWEGGVRMPLIARWPGRVPAGTTSGEVVSLTDILATVAALLGVALPDGAGEDSFDISPALLGKTPERPLREAVVVQSTDTAMLAIRQGPWKLIPWLGSGGFLVPPKTRPPQPGEPVGQLYNLTDDPAEQQNLYDQHPEIVRRLSELLEHYRQSGHSR